MMVHWREGTLESDANHRSAKTDRRRRYGYSLVELIIGLVILAVLSAVAIPVAARWLDGVRVRAAATQILWAMEEAKSLSVSSGTSQEVVFRVSEGRLHLPGKIDPRRRTPPHTLELGAGIVIAGASLGQPKEAVFRVRDRGRSISSGRIVVQGKLTWLKIEITAAGIVVGGIREGAPSAVDLAWLGPSHHSPSLMTAERDIILDRYASMDSLRVRGAL